MHVDSYCNPGSRTATSPFNPFKIPSFQLCQSVDQLLAGIGFSSLFLFSSISFLFLRTRRKRARSLILRPLYSSRGASVRTFIMAFLSIPSPRRWVALLSLSLGPILGAADATPNSAADYYVRDLPGLPADGPNIKMHAG